MLISEGDLALFIFSSRSCIIGDTRFYDWLSSIAADDLIFYTEFLKVIDFDGEILDTEVALVSD